MLRDITIGQHFPGTSLVHRFDPRMKLVLTIVYIVLLFAASNPLGLTLSIPPPPQTKRCLPETSAASCRRHRRIPIEGQKR